MFGTHDLWLFVLSGLMLNIVPGPDSLLILARSATGGWRAGSAAALGIGAGTLVHVAAGAAGLSALLATSATAFTVVKGLGALYLLWLGLGLLRAGRAAVAPADVPVPLPAPAPDPAAWRWAQVFAQGFLTNVLNPKVALFFLAFVPQFIAPDAPSKPLAFVLLGLVFDANGMLWCHFLAVSGALASRRLQLGARSGRALQWLMGLLVIGLGLRLALAPR